MKNQPSCYTENFSNHRRIANHPRNPYLTSSTGATEERPGILF